MTAKQTETQSLIIRPTTVADSALILHLITELAEYEKLSSDVVASTETIADSLFGEQPCAECVIADIITETENQPAGFALFFHNYSTFVGKKGLYLEDLFVRPEFRDKGIGKALLAHLAQIAVDRDCGRFEWAVLDWNEPAIGFYKKLGAEALDGWTVFRMSGAGLESLAAQSSDTTKK